MEIIKSTSQLNAEIMRNSYLARGKNTAGFIMQQTKLFEDQDGTRFEPYPKQVHFMNLLKDNDRIVVALKPRQCIIGKSMIALDGYNLSIVNLYKMYSSDKHINANNIYCLSYDEINKRKCYDRIIDIWEAGIKPVYEIKLFNGEHLTSTLEHKYHVKDKGFIKLKDIIVDTDLIYTNKEYSKIKTVTSLGNQMTYDLTTEKHHNYFANGINVHNSGFSTSIVAKACYEGYFGLVPEICIVSATRPQADKVLDRIKDAFLSMHESLRPEFELANKSLLKFQNGCKIYSLSSNPDSARGFTGNIYLDEFAMIPSKDSFEIWRALYPSITKGKSRIVATSTPKGRVGKFYDLCTKEIDKKNTKLNKVLFQISWRDVPHIVHAVNENGLFEGLTHEDIQQEYESNFLTSSEDPYFTEDFILTYYLDRDGNIELYTSYDELGIPEQYFNLDNLNERLAPAYYVRNNDNLVSLSDRYSRFVGSWDIASTNDDSILKIAGQVGNSDLYEIVGEFLLNPISTDTIQQAKYAKRIIHCFQLESFCVDNKGLGRSVCDFLEASDGTEQQDIDAERMKEILIRFETNLQNKIDNYSLTKSDMVKGNRKRRFDGGKYDQKAMKQFSNVYLLGGKLVKKNGKDDYTDAEALLTVAIHNSNQSDGGFHVIDIRNSNYVKSSNDGSGIFLQRNTLNAMKNKNN